MPPSPPAKGSALPRDPAPGPCPAAPPAARHGEKAAQGMKRREKAAAEKVAHARVTADELAEWRSKAQAAGVTLSELLRQAMRRTRAWTASAADIERARVREIARIGNNLNQLARWANTHKAAAEAVAVLAQLRAIEGELAALRRRAGAS